jgi:hypothetical protein
LPWRSRARGQACRHSAAGLRPRRSTARQAAPIDLTGTWVAVVTEDWRWRMVTPPKGDVSSIPVNGEGRKAALAWDLSGRRSERQRVPGVRRRRHHAAAGRLRISWQDPSTLKLEFDAGTQTRILTFDRARSRRREDLAGLLARRVGRARHRPWSRGAARTGRGPAGPPVPGGGGQGLRGGPPPRGASSIQRGGSLKVVTTNFKAGYLRKNGVPYSEQASITEYCPPPARASERRRLAERGDGGRGPALSGAGRSTPAATSARSGRAKFAPSPMQDGIAPLAGQDR